MNQPPAPPAAPPIQQRNLPSDSAPTKHHADARASCFHQRTSMLICQPQTSVRGLGVLEEIVRCCRCCKGASGQGTIRWLCRISQITGAITVRFSSDFHCHFQRQRVGVRTQKQVAASVSIAPGKLKAGPSPIIVPANPVLLLDGSHRHLGS